MRGPRHAVGPDTPASAHCKSADGILLLPYNLADINCVDRWGGYPLMDAIRGKHYAIKDLLSSHGAKLSEEDVVKLGQEICLASAQ